MPYNVTDKGGFDIQPEGAYFNFKCWQKRLDAVWGFLV